VARFFAFFDDGRLFEGFLAGKVPGGSKEYRKNRDANNVGRGCCT